MSLLDRSGRFLKMEPLATVTQLERFLLKMVAKQWYDYDRSSYAFVRRLKEPGTKLTFRPQHDFDDNGLIYWVGTNGKWVLFHSSISYSNDEDIVLFHILYE